MVDEIRIKIANKILIAVSVWTVVVIPCATTLPITVDGLAFGGAGTPHQGRVFRKRCI